MSCYMFEADEHIATKVIDEDISEKDLTTTGSLTGKANMESPTNAPSPENPLPADGNDIEKEPEAPPEVWEFGQTTTKKKKKHPRTAMWE
jgi:hypothetical protein